MNVDPWLQRWLPLIQDHARGLPVLELGCGSGDDTATLCAAGQAVMAIDISKLSIAKAKTKAPAEYYCQDIRAPFPRHATGLGVVVASLSLHYFEWSETIRLIERIRCTLAPGGVLLSRFNVSDPGTTGLLSGDDAR